MPSNKFSSSLGKYVLANRVRGLSVLFRALAPRHAALNQTPKVLFVYRFCGLGGVETATIAKVAALRRVGVDASIFFSKFYGDGAKHFATLPFVRVGLPKEKELVQLLHKGFDALFVIDYPGFLDVVFRNKVESSIFFETHSSLPSSLTKFYRHLSDPRIQAIIAPSYHNRRLVLERVRPPCDVLVVPNAIDTSLFRPDGHMSGPIISGISDRAKLVLWVGRLEDEKNPGELIDIANETLGRTTGVEFIVVGDRVGDDRGVYERGKSRLIEKLDASKRDAVHFIRALPYESMPGLYRLVSQSGGVLLSTSRHESLPMIFIEAMASGCPVISTDVGGVRDLILDGLTGRLYKLGDVRVAATLLQWLLASENRRAVMEMTQRARTEIMKRHSLHAVTAQYEAILNRVRS